jgi:hypothetical protein
MILDDDRVKFYLRNRDQIEQWAALRAEAALAMDEWLCSLAPDVKALADRLSGENKEVLAVATTRPEDAYPKLRLTRPGWLAPPETGGGVSVCLEWQRARTTLSLGGAHAVRRCPRGEDDARRRRGAPAAARAASHGWAGAHDECLVGSALEDRAAAGFPGRTSEVPRPADRRDDNRLGGLRRGHRPCRGKAGRRRPANRATPPGAECGLRSSAEPAVG